MFQLNLDTSSMSSKIDTEDTIIQIKMFNLY